MKIKTSQLTGAQLDWAVAKCAGLRLVTDTQNKPVLSSEAGLLMLADLDWAPYSPSTLWAQGGPIIEREKLWVGTLQNGATWGAKGACHYSYGPTPLIAAMRCFLASKLDPEIDIPDNL